MIEIRKATIQDLQGIADVLRAFRADPIAPDFARAPENTKAGEYYICSAIPHSFVATKDDTIIGVLLSHIGSVPVNPNAKFLEESHWYVLQEFRSGSTGFRLFKAWKDYALGLKVAGEIRSILTHTMADSPVDMRRHGCRTLQTTFEVIE